MDASDPLQLQDGRNIVYQMLIIFECNGFKKLSENILWNFPDIIQRGGGGGAF